MVRSAPLGRRTAPCESRRGYTIARGSASARARDALGIDRDGLDRRQHAASALTGRRWSTSRSSSADRIAADGDVAQQASALRDRRVDLVDRRSPIRSRRPRRRRRSRLATTAIGVAEIANPLRRRADTDETARWRWPVRSRYAARVECARRRQLRRSSGAAVRNPASTLTPPPRDRDRHRGRALARPLDAARCTSHVRPDQ